MNVSAVASALAGVGPTPLIHLFSCARKAAAAETVETGGWRGPQTDVATRPA
jgi:hypothetical protein